VRLDVLLHALDSLDLFPLRQHRSSTSRRGEYPDIVADS